MMANSQLKHPLEILVCYEEEPFLCNNAFELLDDTEN